METKITLRKAVKEDQQQIRRLVWGARLNPSGVKWPRFVVGVDSSGEVVACAQVKPHRDGSHELASLVVRPEYRGQGIARLLVEYWIQHHEGDLYLMCRASLGGFYRRFGFEAVVEGDLPPYFRRISRLASLFQRRRDPKNGLLIMRRERLDLSRGSGSWRIQPGR